jgi:hypothetical protein
MKMYGGVEVQLHIFLTLELNGQLHAPAASPPQKYSPVQSDGGWVGPRTYLSDAEETKFLPLLELEPNPSVIQPVTIRYTNCAILVP